MEQGNKEGSVVSEQAVGVAEVDDKQSEARSIDSKKIQGKVHHVLRLVSQSVKRAKTFETQRTVKRLKAHKAKSEDASDSKEGREALEKELEATKAIDTQAVAVPALLTKLGKARMLPRGGDAAEGEEDKFPLVAILGPSHVLIKEAQKRREQSKDGSGPSAASAHETVRSRLVSSKVVSDEVSKGVEEIGVLLGLTSQKRSIEKVRKGPSSVSKEPRSLAKEVAKPEKVRIEPRDTAESESSDENEEDANSLGEADGKKIEQTKERKRKRSPPVASSEEPSPMDEEDGLEENEEEDGDSMSGSEDEEEATFLPSLATGFVGGRGLNLGRRSDDEWSDGDAELESIDSDAEDRGLDGKVRAGANRKNRMGQRARKALWEKKYGRNANHLKLRERETRAEKEARGRGPPISMGGAQGMHPDRLRRNMAVPGGQRGFERSFDGARKGGEERQEKKQKTEEMHPSWVAKQKQKEIIEAAARAAASGRSTTKKIVFD